MTPPRDDHQAVLWDMLTGAGVDVALNACGDVAWDRGDGTASIFEVWHGPPDGWRRGLVFLLDFDEHWKARAKTATTAPEAARMVLRGERGCSCNPGLDLAGSDRREVSVSHYSCIVIGEDPEAQLAPYHEFECTGRNDQYVQDIDETTKRRAEYEADTDRWVDTPEGRVSYYDDRFYHRPPGGFGLERRPDAPGEDAVVVVPSIETRTFAEWLEYDGRARVPFGQEPDLEGAHKYGYFTVDENGEVIKVIDRTNPHATWDWYQIGGRWSGFFPLKPGASGGMGERSWASGPRRPGTADRCRLKDIDVARARREARAKAGAAWESWGNVLAQHPRPMSWAEARVAVADDSSQARELYHAQPAIVAYNKTDNRVWDCPVAHFGFDRDAYITREESRALMTYAVVKDGQWYARGKMGWWGVSTHEVDDWDSQFAALMDGLAPDTQLTLVDCHI